MICLIVDDSRTIRRGIRLALEREALFDRILEARDGEEGMEVVDDWEARGGVDLVLVDLIMPGLDGFGFLQILRQRAGLTDVPVIVLTGQESVDKKVKALDAGASDYLTKPFDPAELVARVKVHLKVKVLQDQLRDANARLRELAVRDPLTGLFNRRYFLDRLEAEFERSRRHDQVLSLLLVDVDHFKVINDTHGHLVGDQVLISLTESLQGRLRRHDSIARYGGEEFVVLLPHTGRTEAAAVGESLREVIAERSFGTAQRIPTTVSIGVACFPDKDIETFEELLGRADEALYKAKALGRDRVAMWIGEFGEAASVAVQE